MKFSRLIAAGVAAAGLLFATSANAAFIAAAGPADANGTPANTLISSFGGDLRFTFVSRSASLDSDLFVVSVMDQFVFDNDSMVGDSVVVSGPMSGLEILMRIAVENGSIFFSGAAANNADGFVHALISPLGGGVFRVGFEDLRGPFRSGEPDYNDFVFDVQEVPVPGAALLLLSGIAGLGFAARRKAAA